MIIAIFPTLICSPVSLDDAWIDALRSTIQELPQDRSRRLTNDYGLPDYDAGVLTGSRALADYLKPAWRCLPNPR